MGALHKWDLPVINWNASKIRDDDLLPLLICMAATPSEQHDSDGTQWMCVVVGSLAPSAVLS